MSMGHYGCCCDIVQKEFIQEQCPEEYQALLDACTDKMSIETFASIYEEQDVDIEEEFKDLFKSVFDVYEKLTKAFNIKTGLGLCIGYHNPEEGYPRGDDVYKSYWSVGGVYERTEAGKKWEQKIQHGHWVIFG